MSNWTMQLTWPVILLTLAVVGMTVYLSWRNLRHAPVGRRTWMLEGLRGLIVLVALATLLRPERVVEQQRQRNPELVVLIDQTDSMRTEDVSRSVDGQRTLVSRADWTAATQAAAPWAALGDLYDISVETIETGAGPDGAGGTDLNTALQRVAEAHPHLRAVLLMSDGDWNQGEPPLGAATAYRLHGVPIYALTVGSDYHLPDVALEDVRAPAFGLQHERIAVPFRIRNHLQTELRTTVQLHSNGVLVVEKPIVVPPGRFVQDTLIWTARQLGEFTMKLSIPVADIETDSTNNAREFQIVIRQEQLKVLVVESQPRWEFRYLRNALMRDPGVQVDCLLLHPQLGVAKGDTYIDAFPASRDEISRYDVIFLGDVGLGAGELTPENLELIAGLVSQQGSGLVFLPGPRGRHLTLTDGPLGELYPVILDPAEPKGRAFRKDSQLILTRQGEDHLLTMLAGSPAANRALWKRLPGFYWHAAVQKARPGSEVLAVHETYRNEWGRLPLLATRPHGNGYVLFMGTDGAWRWRKGVEDTYHYRFWGQVVRWMAHPRHLSHGERARLIYNPETPRRGDSVFLQATVFDAAGFPIHADSVYADVRSDSGQAERLTLAPVPGGWGVFSGQFSPRFEGDYSVTLTAPGMGEVLESRISVSSRTLEAVGQPAQSTVMADIAGLSGGRHATAEDLPLIIGQLRDLPEAMQVQLRYRLWSQWWWGLGLILAMAGLWSLRKLWGLT